MFRLKINPFLIIHFISIVLVFESLFMLLAVLISIFYRESTTNELFMAFSGTLVAGILLNAFTVKLRGIEPSRRESVIIVSISWIILGLIGTVPYLVTGAIPVFTDAFFESVSGFTTTGSSILADIEALPKSILFWRAETHWIGGMGIIVLVVAVMPFLKINGLNLFHSETSSASEEKISIRIRKVARNLWLVYIGLTILETIILVMGRMPLFDSVCHSFATIATGGFSTKNSSIAGYSPFIQYVVAIFMLLAGINFALHVFALKRKFKGVYRNEELRLYLLIILLASLTISVLLYQSGNTGFEKAFRDSFFQVVSIITATGFATTDYLQWPVQAMVILGILMLIGASAGSTGGGVKVIRHLIALKKIGNHFKSLVNPNAITVIRYNRNSVNPEYVSGIIAFIVFYYIILAISVLIMMAAGQDAATSYGAVATCMAGIGPGFGTVGPVANFLHMPGAIKYFLMFLMIIGRLEIYSFIIIFTRSFWRY